MMSAPIDVWSSSAERSAFGKWTRVMPVTASVAMAARK